MRAFTVITSFRCLCCANRSGAAILAGMSEIKYARTSKIPIIACMMEGDGWRPTESLGFITAGEGFQYFTILQQTKKKKKAIFSQNQPSLVYNTFSRNGPALREFHGPVSSSHDAPLCKGENHSEVERFCRQDCFGRRFTPRHPTLSSRPTSARSAPASRTKLAIRRQRTALGTPTAMWMR